MNLYVRILNFIENFDNLELKKDNATNGYYYKNSKIWLKMNEIEKAIFNKFKSK